ncbi:hypothetical protein FRB99_005891 [Tulasnella sp. 403]|nr:hypothetical protein FRB99_005891 [Tulasnella sp. 403]
MSTAIPTRFVPSASLAGAPEDILVQIFSLLPVIDILAVRRCCRRLYFVTHARIVWLEAMRTMFVRRFLPHLAKHRLLARLPTPTLENRATRPWRLLHALADIANARYRQWSHELNEEIMPPGIDDDGRGRNGVVNFHLIPGGRFLCLIINRRPTADKPAADQPRAIVFIWDLWRVKLVLKNGFARSCHFAHVHLDQSGNGIVLILGFDKTRTQDPFFSSLFISFPADPIADIRPTIVRMSGLKVERSPRACSVFGETLAFADRLGNIVFWNWREQSSARIFVPGWPPTKGKIMMLSAHHIAIFNPASSTFAVHLVPILTPIVPPSNNGDNPLLRYQGELVDNRLSLANPAPVPSNLDYLSQPLPLSLAPPSGPSLALKRFRLPSRSLNIILPCKIPASAFYPTNSFFPDPFLAYFILVHPENLSGLYLGIIPEIDVLDPDAVEQNQEVETDDEDEDEDEEQGSSAEQQGAGSQNSGFAPPAVVSQPNNAPAPHGGDEGPGNGDIPPIPLQPPPPAPTGPEPTWLNTLRCVDSTSPTATFAPHGRLIYSGTLDHSLCIMRVTDQGKIEMFTSAALHSKPEVPPPPDDEELNTSNDDEPERPGHLQFVPMPYLGPIMRGASAFGGGQGGSLGHPNPGFSSPSLVPNSYDFYGLINVPGLSGFPSIGISPTLRRMNGYQPKNGDSRLTRHNVDNTSANDAYHNNNNNDDLDGNSNAVAGPGPSSAANRGLVLDPPQEPWRPPFRYSTNHDPFTPPNKHSAPPVFIKPVSRLSNNHAGPSRLRSTPEPSFYLESPQASPSTGKGKARAGPSSARSSAPAPSSRLPSTAAPRKRPRRGSDPPTDVSGLLQPDATFLAATSTPRPTSTSPSDSPSSGRLSLNSTVDSLPASMFTPKTTPNPHARLGPYAEGDYQVLSYNPEGEILAATMEDTSGKICFVVEKHYLSDGRDSPVDRQPNASRFCVVVLDYGWDFVSPGWNEEHKWNMGARSDGQNGVIWEGNESVAEGSGTQGRSQSV